MNTKARNPLSPIPAPSPKARLTSWWGIYIGICFVSLLIIGKIHGLSLMDLYSGVIFLPLIPMGLVQALAFPIEWFADRYWDLGPAVHMWATLLSPLSYLIFGIHLRLTSHAKTRRTFLLLLFSLALLSTASFIATMKVMSLAIRG